jgi:AraC-like DNA-binding protein
VDLALRNADRLRQLIDQLFDLVRLEAGRLPMRARRIRIGRFLEELVSRHRPIAMARGLELILDLRALGNPDPNAGGRPIILWADPDLLEKAVGNLLSNALKFTPKGGTVALSVTIEAGEVRILVQDEGPGVAAEHRERIFERYYQAESGGHQSAEGAGIGLSLARELAELQGGSLQLLEGGAAGATFALSLPSGTDHLSIEDIGLDEPSDPSFPTPIRPPPPVGSRPRVLLVEDHPELRAYLAARLSAEVDVEAVGDGETALLRLRAGGFGLPAPLEVPSPVEAPPPVEAGQAPLNEAERALLDRLLGIARARMSDPSFTVEVLASAVAMSPRTLQRVLNRLSGKAPSSWLQELRLESAQDLLRRGGSVSEAADAVGMAPAYLSRVYKAWFGYPPSREERSRGG